MNRTQIYLPKELREEIDRQCLLTGESLATYLRKAAENRIKSEKAKKADLKKLADDFIGSSTRTDKEIKKWLEWAREERRLSDKVREERLQKALKKRNAMPS